MKRVSVIFCVILSFFLFFSAGVHAAYLKFDKDSFNTQNSSQFEVKVIIDTEGEEVVSSDVYVSYDDTLLEPVNVVAGDFFDIVNSDFLEGKVYVAGIMENVATGKSGTGTIATITFRAKNPGTTTLAYICDPNETQTSKIIKAGIDAPNIINCNSNQSASIEIVSSSNNSSGQGSSNSSANNSANSSSSSNSSSPSQLPKAGIFDRTVSFATWGIFFVIFGFLLKFFLGYYEKF